MVLVLLCEPASPVAPETPVGAWTLELEIDQKHKSAALQVVLGGVGLHSTEPHPSVFRALPVTSHLGCVMLPSAVAWMMALLLVLVAAVTTSCPGVVVALFQVPPVVEVLLLTGRLPPGVDGSRNLTDSFPSLDNVA